VDAKYVNPFVESFSSVMPQLGFANVRIGKLSAKKKEVITSGVLIILGVVGDIKGNVVYTIDIEAAKQIASTMMMGTPVDELDDIAKSALSELTNMLTANAATVLADIGIRIDISVPTFLIGENMCATMNSDKILCVRLYADDIPIEINISFED
jgi:chemotaxis protein CheX